MSFPMPISSYPARGTGYRAINIPTKSGEQSRAFSEALAALQPYLGGAVGSMGRMASGQPEQFEQMEAPAMRQYQQLLGNIGARYSGMGMGAQKSSAFQNEMSSAASDLAERLQSQRLSMQQSAQEQLMNLFKSLMGEDLFDTQLMPKKSSFYKQFGLGMAPGMGQALGSLPFMF